MVISIHNKDGYIAGYGWKGNDVFLSLLRLRNASDIEVVNKRIQSVIEKYTSTGFYNFICEYSAIPLVNYHWKVWIQSNVLLYTASWGLLFSLLLS